MRWNQRRSYGVLVYPRRLVNALNRSRALVAPPPALTVTEWAAKNLVLPRGVAAEPGCFSPDRFPWQRGQLDSITDPTIAEHVWIQAAQTGKTSNAIAVCGYFIQHDPSPILVKYPNEKDAESFSKEKLTPVIDESPALKAVVAAAKSRDSENTILFKRFRGGFLAMVGANSPSGLRRRSIRVVIQDEIDADAPSSGDEGDPVALADKRAETFSDAILVKMSTPTLKGLSRIERAFDLTDKQYFFCPCPRCGYFQTLKFDNIHWLDDRTHEAWLECEACKAHLSDAERIQMIARGQWRPTAVFRGRRGHHLNGFYRVIGLKRHRKDYLDEFIQEYLEAKKSDENLIVWTNTVKAESYEQKTEKIDELKLAERAEKYTPTTLPPGVLVLTAGVDVQENRLEAECRGYGVAEESWGVEYKAFIGDPKHPAVWQQLEDWLLLPRRREDGVELKISAVGLDTGHATKNVYEFARPRFMRGVFAVKGRGGAGLPLVSLPRKSSVSRVRLFIVGTDTGKSLIYSRLNLTEPGKGFIHFPSGYGYDATYFAGLTSEVIVIKWLNGKPVKVFEERGRNEPLDCKVYGLSALSILNPNLERISKLLAKQAEEIKAQQPAPEQPSIQQEKPAPQEPEVKPRRPRRSGWMGGIGGIGKWRI